MFNSLDIFCVKKIKFLFIFSIVALLFGFSAYISDFNFFQGIIAIPKALIWMAQNLIPDTKALAKLPKILDKLLETILLSVVVTTTAGIFAFIFSLMGTTLTKNNKIKANIIRTIAAFSRNIPDVVWAMLLMFSFGQNIITGYFALFFTTFGLLTRAFIETIDEGSSECVEALEATGAYFSQIVLQAIIPSSITGIITWILYMIETNIRASTLIGILTATGIGYSFDLYYKRLDFSAASLVVISIVIVVLLIESISNKIRKEIN